MAISLQQICVGRDRKYHFINLAEKEGFYENHISCIIQDKKGYVWFGSQNGLYRYDGYKKERIINKRRNANAITSKQITGIAEDRDGRIWVATPKEGLYCYDPVKKSFTNYMHSNGDTNSLVTDKLMRLCVDRKNRLWIGYANAGWSVLDIDKNKMAHFRVKTTFVGPYGNDAANTPDPFCEDKKNGGMWITSGYGLHFQDANNKITTYCDINHGNAAQQDNLFLTICQTNDTTIWLGTWGAGLKKFNTRTKKFSQYIYERINPVSAIHNIVGEVVQKTADELWIGAVDKGLGIFNITTGKFSFIAHDPENPASPVEGGCYRAFKDRSGTFWAIFYKGVSLFAARSAGVVHVPVQHISKTDEYSEHVTPVSFHKDTAKGLLYMGCDVGKGLYIVDEKGGTETIVNIPRTRNKPSIFDRAIVYSIAPVDGNKLLLATNYGLHVFEKDTRAIKVLPIKDQEQKTVYVVDILKCNKGFWCNSSPTNGFYFIDSGFTKAIHYYAGSASPIPFENKRERVVLVENDSLIWVSMVDSGLYRMNPVSNSLQLLNGRKNGAFFGSTMVKIKQGSYWFSTDQNGVFFIRQERADSFTCTQYAEEEGLPTDFTSNLLLDDNGNLWVSTHKGPAMYMKARERFISLSGNKLISDRSGEFADLYKSPDGYLYTGIFGEYFKWHTDSLLSHTPKPQLYLTSIKVSGETYYDTANLDKLEEVVLPFDKNTVSVEFVALDFPAPGAIHYSYKLDGLSGDWIPVEGRAVAWPGLPDGRYHLHVKATNGMGQVAAREISLRIRILPPFWKTWWFIALCISIVAGIVVLVFRNRIAAIREAEDTKTKFSKMMAEVEMRALRAQMNPHFLFNCLNSINRYIVVNDTVKASGYLTKFSKLIRLILDNSANDVTSLDNEISLLRLYTEMEFMRFDGKFTYDIDVDKSLSCETISIPSMIIQPYIENAIWHGLLNKGINGHMLVKVYGKGPNKLEVTIEDNGIGRQKAKELSSKNTLKQKSYGMKITNDRIKAMNQLYDAGASVIIEDMMSAENEPSGTRVILKIPYTKLNMESNMFQFL